MVGWVGGRVGGRKRGEERMVDVREGAAEKVDEEASKEGDPVEREGLAGQSVAGQVFCQPWSRVDGSVGDLGVQSVQRMVVQRVENEIHVFIRNSKTTRRVSIIARMMIAAKFDELSI